MSLPAVLARVSELSLLIAPPGTAATTPAQSATSFQGLLQGADLATGGAAPTSALALPPGSGGRGALLAAVQAEVGQAEAPPGSNDSPRIAQYREATAGAPRPGPWCAYFVSWAAKQAGMPIGDSGQGLRRGRLRAGLGRAHGPPRAHRHGHPRPRDLVVWDQHIGVVESVAATARSTPSKATRRTASRGARTGRAVRSASCAWAPEGWRPLAAREPVI